MHSVDELIEFISKRTDSAKIKPDSDLFYDCGITGDDFHELIADYSKTYNVSLDSYLWYFHSDEEGHSGIGQLFSKPPYDRVNRIPVTPQMLTDFANENNWQLEYPEHKIPKDRYDLTINTAIIILVSLGLVGWILIQLVT